MGTIASYLVVPCMAVFMLHKYTYLMIEVTAQGMCVTVDLAGLNEPIS